MYKMMFLFLVVVLGGFYYMKQKGYDVQNLNPNFHPTPTPTPTSTPILKNRYLAGKCLNNEAENFGYVKIENFDNDTNMYQYRFCNKYKGCDNELQQDNLNVFEKQYPETKLMNCPEQLK